MNSLPFHPFTIGRDTTETGNASVPNARLLFVGDNANALYNIEFNPLSIVRIGNVSDFGVGETAPRGIVRHKDKYFMLGQTKQALYEMLQDENGELTGEAKFLAKVNIPNATLQNLASDGTNLVMTANIVGADGFTPVASNIYSITFGASQSDVHFTEVYSFNLMVENQIRGIAYFDSAWVVIGRKSKSLWKVELNFTTNTGSAFNEAVVEFGDVVTEPQSIAEIDGELQLVGNGELYTVDTRKKNLLRNTGVPKGFGFSEYNIYGLTSTKPNQEITIVSQDTINYGTISEPINDGYRVAFQYDSDSELIVPFIDLSAGDSFDIGDYYDKDETNTKIQEAVEGVDTFSGEYADLNGKPDLFDGAYNTLTGKPDVYSKTEANNEFRTSTQVDFQIDEKITALNLPSSDVITTTDKLTSALANRATTEYVDEKIQEVNRREDDRDPFDSALYYTMGQTDTAIETAINAIPVRDINWTDLKNVPADITSRNANTLDSHDSSYFATQTEFDNLSATVNGLNNFDGQYSSLSGLPTIPDVSNFRTSSQIATQISTALTVYYTKTQADARYTTSDAVDVKLQSHYTKAEVDERIPAVPVMNIVGGTNVTVTHQDGVFTINSSGGGGTTTPADGYSYVDSLNFVNNTLTVSQTGDGVVDKTVDLSSLRDGLATSSALNTVSTTATNAQTTADSAVSSASTAQSTADSKSTVLATATATSLTINVDGTDTVFTPQTGSTDGAVNNTLTLNPEGALHLGREGSEADSVSGLLGVNTTSLTANAISTTNMIFDNTIEGWNVPTGGAYNTTTGEIVLPEGEWIICATIRATNIDGGNSAGSSRIFGDLQMQVDGEVRHGQSIYIRHSAGSVGDRDFANNWVTTISGSYESSGTEALSIRAVLSAEEDSSVRFDQAHIHAYKQVVQEELVFQARDGNDGNNGQDGADSTVPGPKGAQGNYRVYLYNVQTKGDTTANGYPDTPSVTGYNPSTGLFTGITVPGWSHEFFDNIDQETNDYFETFATYNPATNTLTTFSTPFKIDAETGRNGEDGADGDSPTANVSKANKTTTITITDGSGTTSATITDGANGNDASIVATDVEGGAQIVATSGDGSKTTANIQDGDDGTDANIVVVAGDNVNVSETINGGVKTYTVSAPNSHSPKYADINAPHTYTIDPSLYSGMVGVFLVGGDSDDFRLFFEDYSIGSTTHLQRHSNSSTELQVTRISETQLRITSSVTNAPLRNVRQFR